MLICPSESFDMNYTYKTYQFVGVSYTPIQGTQDTYYKYITYPYDGVFYPNSRTTVAGVTDGLSNTIYFAERSYTDPGNPTTTTAIRTNSVGWSWCTYAATQDLLLSSENPINSQTCVKGAPFCDDRYSTIGSNHTNGANALFGDGSVHFLTLTSTGQLQTLQALTTTS